MVRRTKADSLATRNSLLDAAEQLFQARGVSRTSLNDIATAAGTTRGAIYWHFKDKADLFNAMMERVTMPLEGTLACGARSAETAADPLLALRNAVMAALLQTASDEQTRRVFEVATHKVEYVTEMQAVRDRHLRVRNECVAMTEEILHQVVLREDIALRLPVPTAALGLHVIMDGLIQNWLLDPDAFDLVASGRHTLNTFLLGLGLPLPEAAEPQTGTMAQPLSPAVACA